jgi:hypothetical protein
MPAKADTQASRRVLAFLGSRFRGNDDVGGWQGFLHTLDKRESLRAVGPRFRGGDGGL